MIARSENPVARPSHGSDAPFRDRRFHAPGVRPGVAGGVRAGYLALCADNAHNPGPLVVQDASAEQDALKNSVRDVNSFTSAAPLADGPEETAHVSPGYPYLLGLLARYVAANQFDSTVRWIQCGLGALTAGLYYLFARRAFRSLAVGVLAGMLCAVHPFWVVDTAAINDGTLASFLVGLVLFTGARSSQVGGPFSSLLYGLSLAGMALTRAALLPFAFVGLAWFLWRSRPLPSGWLAALLGFLGFVIGIAPWTIRNWQVYGEPTPIVDSAYLHLWMGNNPRADGGPVAVEDVLPPEKVQELKEIKKQPARTPTSAQSLGRRCGATRRPCRCAGCNPASRSSTARAPWAGTSRGGPDAAANAVAAGLPGSRHGGAAAGRRTETPPAPAPKPVPMPDFLGSSYAVIFGWTLFGVDRAGAAGLALVLRLAGGVDAGRAGGDLDSVAVRPQPRGSAVGAAPAAGRRAAVLHGVRAVVLPAGRRRYSMERRQGGEPAAAVRDRTETRPLRITVASPTISFLPFQRHLHVLLLAVALDRQRHRVANLVLVQRGVEVAARLHRLAVHRRDHVAELDVAVLVASRRLQADFGS